MSRLRVGGPKTDTVTGVRDWDMIVVGAGPAGCAAAAAARQTNPDAKVLLLDRARFPRDKVCGDGIAGAALQVLQELDLDIEQLTAGHPRIHRLSLRSPGGAVAEGSTTEPSWVVPREIFDARLVDSVLSRGVELAQVRVRQLTDLGDRVDVDGRWMAKSVIVAAGSEPGLTTSPVERHRTAHFAIGLRGYARTTREDVQQLIMSDVGWPAYAWSFPIGDGWANVGYGEAMGRGPAPTRTSMLRHLRALLPDSHTDLERVRAHRLPLAMRRPMLGTGRILKVGDAAHLVNPLSGEGIYYAVASGRAAGQVALAEDSANRYHRAMAEPGGVRHRRHAALLTAALRRIPRLLEAGIGAAADDQRIFDDLVRLALEDGTLTGPMLRGVGRALVQRPRTHIDRPETNV